MSDFLKLFEKLKTIVPFHTPAPQRWMQWMAFAHIGGVTTH